MASSLKSPMERTADAPRRIIQLPAAIRAKTLVNGYGGGIGIQLGELDEKRSLAGVDLDTCIDADGCLAPWAEKILGELPSGLRIREIPVLSNAGKYWAALPSKPVLDREGRQVETNGKRQYTAMLEWRSRELADGFSAKLVALVRQAHPGALDEEARS